MSDVFDGPRPVPERTEPERPGRDRPGRDRPGRDRPGRDRPGRDRPGRDRPAPDDDTVVRLLRLAGHRPPVPAADAETVREAARAEWRKAVWAERRRKRTARGGWGLLAAAALLAVIVATGLPGRLGRLLADPVASVEATAGRVLVAREDAAAMAGTELWKGAVVETAAVGEEPSRAALRLAGGPSVRLDAGSAVRLLAERELELLRGAVYVDSAGVDLEVHAGFSTVTNVGTRFEVRLLPGGESLRVRVRDGAVRLLGVDEPVGERSEVVLHADGRVDGPVELLPYGPEWEWVTGILPPMADARPTARQVLDWVAAEAGLELRLSPEVEPASLDATLEGTGISGGLEDRIALALLPLGVPLEYRIEDGELWIEPKPIGGAA